MTGADLRSEALNKATKFWSYGNAENTGATRRVPNYFYYMVPADLR